MGVAAPDRSTAVRKPPAALLPVAMVAGWLVPGLGHCLLRHRVKGLIFFLIVTSCFFAAIRIGGPRIVSTTDDRLSAVAQLMNGGLGLGYLYYAENEKTMLDYTPALEFGKLYSCVAGLLNLLIVLDVWSAHYRLCHPVANALAGAEAEETQEAEAKKEGEPNEQAPEEAATDEPV